MKKSLQTVLCGVTIAALTCAPLNAYALSQDETVYVKLQPNGEVDYTSVTKHLINEAQTPKLLDRTKLQNIENLNGFEAYTLNGTEIAWDANGSDIYYKGEINQKLPVEVEISYKLDGKTQGLDEMIGKSGDVEIELKYRNSTKVGDLYVPFVVAMATTLPAASTHSLTVTNGKMISNGKSLAVAAVAAPGLRESLQIDQLQDFDKIVLKFRTDSFELGDIYSVVTPKVLDETDLKIFDEVNELSGKMQQLSDSSKELVDGANELYVGVQELYDALLLAQTQYQQTGKLLDNATLTQISTTAASAARKKVSSQENKIRQQIHQQVAGMLGSSGLQEQLVEQLALKICLLDSQKPAPAPTPTPEEPDTTPDTDAMKELGSSATIETGSDDTPGQADADTELMPVADSDSAEKVTPQADPAPKPVTINCTDPAVLQAYVAQVKPIIAQNLAQQLNLAAIEEKLYQSTIASLRQVAGETASATARSVATEVADSIQEGFSDKITEMLDTMSDSVKQVLIGVGQLSSGLKQFDSEGIQTLYDFTNGRLQPASQKLKRLTKLAEDYNNFSGIANDVNGEVKFVMMVDGKKKV